MDKSRHEMHAAVQSGGSSPKDLNGPASTLKTSSLSTQNTSFPSQVKGRKGSVQIRIQILLNESDFQGQKAVVQGVPTQNAL